MTKHSTIGEKNKDPIEDPIDDPSNQGRKKARVTCRASRQIRQSRHRAMGDGSTVIGPLLGRFERSIH